MKNTISQSGWKASIDKKKCTNCGLCKEKCRFNAIHYKKNSGFEINPFQCEGCRLCERICPAQAINSEQNNNNFWYVSDTRLGTLIHAWMGPGEENSGKLVTEVRNKAKNLAKKTNTEIIINDGPPGIGCAAIASITGTDSVLLAIEPTKSGLHDIKRLVELIHSFNIPMFATINKYDINKQISDEIELFLKEKNIPLLSKIPFDTSMVEAMVKGKTIVEYQPKGKIAKLINKTWYKLINYGFAN